MEGTALDCLRMSVNHIRDPRVEGRSDHLLFDIVIAHAIRSHWGIENSLHWTMDVSFREDHHRLLDRNGVQNLSAIRRLAVSILRQDKTTKVGAQNKRLKAALDPNYLIEVMENAMF